MTFSERYKLFYRHRLGFLLHPSVQFKSYQNNARIYLDEYEVEEWDYLPLFDNSLIMQRFLVKE